MQKKILLSYIIIILLAIGISATTFWNTGYKHIENENSEHYIKQAELIAEAFELTQFNTDNDFSNFTKNFGEKYSTRITVIDSDGEVLSDSETREELENHSDREEVMEALSGEKTSIIRHSETLGLDYFYYAIPVSNDSFSGVLRIATPLHEISNFNDSVKYSIIRAIIVCIIIASLAAFLFTELIYKPIEEITEAAEHISNGDYSIKIYKKGKSHIARLASAFNTMSSNLNDTIHNLTQRKTELEAILGSMAGGVIALNDNDEILFFNKSFINIMALEDKKESMKGSSIYSIVRNVTIYNTMDKVRDKNKKVKLEGAGTKKNQTISVTGTLLVAGSRELFGVLLIVEDITQIKKLENVRSDFVSNVTHELKTPLTSIKGFIETLRYGKVEKKEVANKFLDIIDIEVERLSRLIEDILLLSEIESRDERETILCDINKVATDVLELLEHKISDNDKVKIVYEAPSYIKPFSGNPDRIKELFINLIDNAIKYTEEGTIKVACKEQDENLFILVKDSGVGIPKKDLPRIFERFYRVDKGRSRKMGGTGLGLSIVKHIVQLYDGNIEVESSLDKGTEFRITLPYKRQKSY